MITALFVMELIQILSSTQKFSYISPLKNHISYLSMIEKIRSKHMNECKRGTKEQLSHF